MDKESASKAPNSKTPPFPLNEISEKIPTACAHEIRSLLSLRRCIFSERV